MNETRVVEPDTRSKLRAIVGERKALARGEMTRLAEQLDVSRERVRQICVEFGIKSIPSLKQPEQDCVRCGKRLGQSNKSGYCQECRTTLIKKVLLLTCTKCGREFQRTRKEHKSFLRRRPRRRAGPYCSKTCSTKIVADCIFCGEVAPPRWRKSVRSLRFGPMHYDCVVKARSLMTPSLWGHLTADYLPILANYERIIRDLGHLRVSGRVARASTQVPGHPTRAGTPPSPRSGPPAASSRKASRPR